jgi:hypothetical protein
MWLAAILLTANILIFDVFNMTGAGNSLFNQFL